MTIDWEHPSSVLGALGVRPQKKFSQNFLSNRHAAEDIAENIDRVANSDAVFEIGAGTGSLTVFLSKNFDRVFVSEIDDLLCGYLKEKFNNTNVSVLCEDALKIDLYKLLVNDEDKMAVAGNVPYAISSPLLGMLASQKDIISAMVLMFQKEFAQRLLAPPGDRNCSVLGIITQFDFEVSLLMKINRGSFYPAPDVDSVVLEFIPRSNTPFVADSKKFSALLHVSFAHRRKKLANNLISITNDKSVIGSILQDADISSNARAEELSWNDWGRLYNVFEKLSLLEDIKR